VTTAAAGATYAAEAISVPDDIQHSPLWNKDLAPTPLSRRTWSTYNIAALWIGMSVVITTYTLASGLMQEGMTWWQALMTILLGNVIVLVPMVLNAHAGTKYGISFPVMCRASFGVRGANIPAMLRAVVACGWFGIQTWIGALALNTLFVAAWPSWASVTGGVALAFAMFWLIQVAIIARGIEGIKMLGSYAAPFLLSGGILLLLWGIRHGGGLGHILTESQRLQGKTSNVSFWRLFPPALTANVGYWATLSLNIPDFTRYARSQRSQVTGDDRDFRKGYLGSRRSRDDDWRPRADNLCGADRARGSAPHQHGGQRRLARERLFASEPEAYQLRDRRNHHRDNRDSHDALEAVCGRGGVHLHMADRILQPHGRARWNSHL